MDKKSGLVTEEGLDYRQYHPKVHVYTECHSSSINKGERHISTGSVTVEQQFELAYFDNYI